LQRAPASVVEGATAGQSQIATGSQPPGKKGIRLCKTNGLFENVLCSEPEISIQRSGPQTFRWSPQKWRWTARFWLWAGPFLARARLINRGRDQFDSISDGFSTSCEHSFPADGDLGPEKPPPSQFSTQRILRARFELVSVAVRPKRGCAPAAAQIGRWPHVPGSFRRCVSGRGIRLVVGRIQSAFDHSPFCGPVINLRSLAYCPMNGEHQQKDKFQVPRKWLHLNQIEQIRPPRIKPHARRQIKPNRITEPAPENI